MRRATTLCVGLSLLLTALGSGNAGDPSPESLGAHWAKISDQAAQEFLADGMRTAAGAAARIYQRNFAAAHRTAAPLLRSSTPGAAGLSAGSPTHAQLSGVSTIPSSGETFMYTPVSKEESIDRLSRDVTVSRLSRRLFGAPDRTASYYTVHYMQSAPYVSATYIQFVTDPSWNRIVYGNFRRWIKSYDNLNGPAALAADAGGRVFVGETGTQCVLVLKLAGDGDDAQLQPAYVIPNISSVSALALSDNGTPLDPSDDFLYAAEASTNSILKYALGTSSAALVSTFTGFETPTALAAGRWNGVNNGLLYVVDKLARRVRVFEDNGTELSQLAEMDGGYHQYFKSIATDHFGNVYLADLVNSQLMKYTASLDYLDGEGGNDLYAGLGDVDIPFGKVIIDGVGTSWAGFDQLFALERWTGRSGVQRRTLGVRLRDVGFGADQDVSAISTRFTLTDFADVAMRIFDPGGSLVRTLSSASMVAGDKTMTWDRRNDAGAEVPPGEYRCELVARTPYRDDPVIAAANLSLPLYYDEQCGSGNPLTDAHLLEGKPVRWGSATANEDPAAVQYRYAGLRPQGVYEIAAEYLSGDGVPRMQDMTAGGIRLHDAVSVTETPSRVGYIKLPPESYASGEVTISINRRGEGSAVVSRLWLKETGKTFASAPSDAPLPTAYSLDQNYPNPFNPSTVIRYAIPEDGAVSVKVYDITGREVATLVNEQQHAGVYQIRFDAAAVRGRGLASGVYFYQVRSGGFVATKKMLLIR